ncbi:MAG: TIGR03936 family radical SAM-associated protein [Acetatifactor sp.]|nr:TIGR03936 family radical SAM-associated protein [Acetatifactor sp.]
MSDHYKLRIKFQKTGAIQYIGHLDVMRFFQKCLRRAQIDVCYTTGFSPHQILTFAAPLSVGLESLGEYMDVEVGTLTSSDDVIERLNAASVPEIKIVSAKLLPEGAGNAMASVAAAKYKVEFFEGRVPSIFLEYSESVHARLDAFLAKESIPYVKEGKKGPREVDLRKGIYDFAWNDAGKFLTMTLDASSGDNVKPFQVLEALLQERGEALSENALKITRLDVYARINASEEDPGDLIPMDEVGSVF